jgi:hypothetical protein
MGNIVKISTKRRHKRISERRPKEGSFSVRDLRDKSFFVVDNQYLDQKWLRLLKGCPSAVYFALCRHADKEQISFPAIPYLMDETGYHKRHVLNAIKTLEFHRLISVDRMQGESNMYSLINRKHWRKAIIVKKYLLTKDKTMKKSPCKKGAE